MQATRYREQARELLVQARTELAAGDLRQASEKGWGAAAQIVKAISEHRGWPHRGHAQLYGAVSNLVGETSDAQIGNLFRSANALHMNFYEGWMNAESVRDGINDVETLLEKLEPLE